MAAYDTHCTHNFRNLAHAQASPGGKVALLIPRPVVKNAVPVNILGSLSSRRMSAKTFLLIKAI